MDFSQKLIIIANILDKLDLPNEANLVDDILSQADSLHSKITKFSRDFEIEEEKKVLTQLLKILIEIKGKPLEKRVEVSVGLPSFTNPWEKLAYNGDNLSGYPKKTVIRAVQAYVEMYVKNYMHSRFKKLDNNIEYGEMIDKIMNLSDNMKGTYKIKSSKPEKMSKRFQNGMDKAKDWYRDMQSIIEDVNLSSEISLEPLEVTRERYKQEIATQNVKEELDKDIEEQNFDSIFDKFLDQQNISEDWAPRRITDYIRELSIKSHDPQFINDEYKKGKIDEAVKNIQIYYNNYFYLLQASEQVGKKHEPTIEESKIDIQTENEEKVIDQLKKIVFSSNTDIKIYGQAKEGSFKKVSQEIAKGFNAISKALDQLEDERDEMSKRISKELGEGKVSEAMKKVDVVLDNFRKYKENIKSVHEISKKLKEPIGPFLDNLLSLINGDMTEKEQWENIHKTLTTKDFREIGSMIKRLLEEGYSKEEIEDTKWSTEQEVKTKGRIEELENSKSWERICDELEKFKGFDKEALSEEINRYLKTHTEGSLRGKIAKILENIQSKYKIDEEKVPNFQQYIKKVIELHGLRHILNIKGTQKKPKPEEKKQSKIRNFVKIGQERKIEDILKDASENFQKALIQFEEIASNFFGEKSSIKRESDNLLRRMKNNKENRENYKTHIHIIENIFGDVGQSGMMGKYSTGNIKGFVEQFISLLAKPLSEEEINALESGEEKTEEKVEVTPEEEKSANEQLIEKAHQLDERYKQLDPTIQNKFQRMKNFFSNLDRSLDNRNIKKNIELAEKQLDQAEIQDKSVKLKQQKDKAVPEKGINIPQTGIKNVSKLRKIKNFCMNM